LRAKITNSGSDRAQLSPIANAARDAMGKTRLRAVADRGYYNAPQIKACADAGIAVILPKPTTSSAKYHGRFDRADFIYIARDDEYQCPAGERAIYRFTREEHGLQLRRYWSSACPRCAMKSQCTPSSQRRISRWEHESVLEAVQLRLDRTPDAMTIRRRTVEHVFGTFKHWTYWAGSRGPKTTAKNASKPFGRSHHRIDRESIKTSPASRTAGFTADQ
jgi:Transposase DDE domain